MEDAQGLRIGEVRVDECTFEGVFLFSVADEAIKTFIAEELDKLDLKIEAMTIEAGPAQLNINGTVARFGKDTALPGSIFLSRAVGVSTAKDPYEKAFGKQIDFDWDVCRRTGKLPYILGHDWPQEFRGDCLFYYGHLSLETARVVAQEHNDLENVSLRVSHHRGLWYNNFSRTISLVPATPKNSGDENGFAFTMVELVFDKMVKFT